MRVDHPRHNDFPFQRAIYLAAALLDPNVELLFRSHAHNTSLSDGNGGGTREPGLHGDHFFGGEDGDGFCLYCRCCVCSKHRIEKDACRKSPKVNHRAIIKFPTALCSSRWVIGNSG